jgi:hypothetical protein
MARPTHHPKDEMNGKDKKGIDSYGVGKPV